MRTLEDIRQLRRDLRTARERAHHLRHVITLMAEHIEDGSPQMALTLARQTLETKDNT
jgi:hypothetical protein